MLSRIALDDRIDPRIKTYFGTNDAPRRGNVTSREELLLEESTNEGKDRGKSLHALLNSFDEETVAPSTAIVSQTERILSQPDGNIINIRLIRPDSEMRLPCVYYIHGGGMMVGSCFDGIYRAWGQTIAANGVMVAMVDFRNSVSRSSVPEVAPFPAGLNDCVSGLKWLHSASEALNIDPKRIVVAGESGGGNLTLALGLKLTREGSTNLIKGLYALCPYIAGEWPQPQYSSSNENNEIILELHNNRGAISYGIEEFSARNPLAWPAFAGDDDVVGYPPTAISVNECDPLREEGVSFYRLLLRNGVAARCRQVMGTTQGVEIFQTCCSEISRETANCIANFCIY